MTGLLSRKSERDRVVDRLAGANTKLAGARRRFATVDEVWRAAVVDGDAGKQATDRAAAQRAIDEASLEVEVLTTRLAEIDQLAAAERAQAEYDEARAVHSEQAAATRAARAHAASTITAARAELLDLAGRVRGVVEELQQAQLSEAEAAARAVSAAEVAGGVFYPRSADPFEQLAVELADSNDRSASWLLAAARMSVPAVIETFSRAGMQHRAAVNGAAVQIVNIAAPTPGTRPADAGFGIDYGSLNRPA
jgi:hypothetical protein